MEKLQDNIDRFLPFGESLRAIMDHPSIKDAERRTLSRMKGVFTDKTDEDSTFPILIASLLSTSEFEYLKESLQAKEDREKTITRTLDWESDKTLIAAIPDNFNIHEIIKTTYPKYSVVGSPNFRPIDGDNNKIALDFKCETADYSQPWYRGKNEFKGRITFEKIETANKKVQLQIIHTSPETTQISEKVVRNLEQHFKSNNYMNPRKEIHRILFREFSNAERVAFLLSMTEGNSAFNFIKAISMEIGPDLAETLPGELKWMEDGKVKDLSINGEILHNIPWLKNKVLHKFVHVAELVVEYAYSISSSEGNCRIQFGFPDYFKKSGMLSAEFVVDILGIYPKDNYLSTPTSSVKTQLLKEFEKYKTNKYEACKVKFRGETEEG
ncbi:MAG: hypothetical protein JST83_10090 [Bacteroidetes bacterium]|nr:hypothetical protein [Bacteroidota bacterium]